MWPESDERPRPLRTGLTTGCCATACSVAAAQALLAGTKTEFVKVKLPRGKVVELVISECCASAAGMIAATIKDAGDDPDVTHGATVFVELSLSTQAGVRFKAAEGVGTVTRAGLPIAVGEAAINPMPRKMITDHLNQIASDLAYVGGFEVAIGIRNGEEIALKTMNARLGIVGGLSILGTTGIVRPFSCSAFIASIHQGIDVAKANGIEHIAATTGNRSEAFIKHHYDLPEMALVEMGDFVGAVLKYLKRQSMKRLILCGGFGKISKLACGHLDLNSKSSQIDFEHLAQCADQAGADADLFKRIRKANTSIEALDLCHQADVDLADVICRKALAQARRILPDNIRLEVWAVDRAGAQVGSALEPPQ